MVNKNKIDSEKALERKVAELTKAHKGMCIKLLSDYITGLPDRLCLFPGQRLVFIELKTTGQKPRRIQLYIHKKLRDLGFRVEVVDNSKQLTEIIESVACPN